MAVAKPVDEAQQYVQQQPVVGADVTSWAQGNADGANAGGSKAWLWVAVTPLVTFFQVMLSRSTEAAQTLLGAAFQGILTSDRHGGYNWVDRRAAATQKNALLCENLSKSRFKCAQASRRSWERLCTQATAAVIPVVVRQPPQGGFPAVGDCEPGGHRVRDGTLARSVILLSRLTRFEYRLKLCCTLAADYEIGSQEKTPLAKTVRTCRQLLKVEPAMWLASDR